MSPEDFKDILRTQPLSDVANDHILTGLPELFASNPMKYRELQTHLATQLNTQPDSVRVVGSGRLGFTTVAERYGASWTAKSDVDVLIIDQTLFDDLWDQLLHWHYPQWWQRLPRDEYEWVLDKQRQIYTGSLMPIKLTSDRLVIPRSFPNLANTRLHWFKVFQQLPRVTGIRCKGFNVKLYQTQKHALLYHQYSLQACRQELGL